MIVRQETPADFEAIDFVNLEAFAPRTEEAALVRGLREGGNTLLSLVAEQNGLVVGHALFSPAIIRAAAGAEYPSAALGPVAVLPERQRQGIGGSLIRAGLSQLAAAGQARCIVLGHPNYYPRFGFETAARHGIRCQWDVPEEAFMVLALQQGGLEGVSGTAYYAPEFEGG